MRIGVPTERVPRERRVATTPEVAGRLSEDGFELVVDGGAGEAAGFVDDAYRQAGAAIGDPWPSSVVLKVAAPTDDEVERLAEGTALIGLLSPLERPDLAERLASRRLTAFALETIPRITRAQPMDALSSQATAAGYQAVLTAASVLGRFFPMLTTAAGTVRPARVLVLGAGVAGLQAIATARRLGARVDAYDVRPAAREQVESLGARFLDIEVALTEEGGAYARQLEEEETRQVLEGLLPQVAESDVVITTALVPGRPAPVLVTREMVEAMQPGSVVLDGAASAGGNCELTRADEEVVHRGVKVLGPTDLPSRLAGDASRMYARNVASLLRHVVRDGELVVDQEDEITSACLIAHGGEVVHPAVRRALGVSP